MSSSDDFSTDSASVWKRLWDLSLPVIGLNVLNVLALAVDTAMCGRLENAEETLSALGFASQLVFLLMVAMLGLTVGTVSQVARAFGAGENGRVRHVVQQSTLLTVGLGILVGVVGLNIDGPLLSMLGASPPVRDLGEQYLLPLLSGAAVTYLSILYMAVLRGLGNTRMPFYVALVANVLNAVLNYGLILGNYGLPALGVQGAAIGTLISQVFSAVVMGFYIRRGAELGGVVKLFVAKFDRALLWDLARVGMPAALDMLVLNISFLAIIGMVGYFSEVAVAAHGIGIRIQALAFVPGMSISQAAAALIGRALGASDIPWAKRITRASVLMCLGIMSVLGVILFVLARSILALVFDVAPGSALEEQAVVWIQILGAGMPIFGIQVALSGMMQGAGITRVSLRINVITTLAIQIPLGYLLGFPLGLGTFGIWLSLPLAFLVKASLSAYIFWRGNWARTGLRS